MSLYDFEISETYDILLVIQIYTFTLTVQPLI